MKENRLVVAGNKEKSKGDTEWQLMQGRRGQGLKDNLPGI